MVYIGTFAMVKRVAKEEEEDEKEEEKEEM